MGRPKLLLPFGEGTVLGATLAALAGGGARRIAVVARPDDPRLAGWLAGPAGEEVGRRLRAGQSAGAGELPELVVAFNPDPERGMLSSVLAGLDALAGAAPLRPEEPLLVCPADLPALSPATVAAVLAALAATGAGTPPGLAVPVHDGRRGHPLGVAPRLVPEIPGLDPAVGLRQLLERRPDEVVEVPVDDPGCVRDLDTPTDYERLQGL
jgi:molybdenum cofactor cytidylyltransferase